MRLPRQWSVGRPTTALVGPAERRLTSEQYLDAIAQVNGFWAKTDAVMRVAVTSPQIRAWRHRTPNTLAIALGQPNREQVCTERNQESTVLQALELVNDSVLEAGARFIEVTTGYQVFTGWDTHENGHSRTVEMMRLIDAPIAQLIRDLDERQLLSRTLVVIASEFSRDMLIEGKLENEVKHQIQVPDRLMEEKHYGMHRHFTGAGGVVLFGGGMKRGFVYGKTTDERPFVTVESPVSIRDLHATLYRAMGIPANLSYEVENRPFFVTEDGKGKVIEAVFV